MRLPQLESLLEVRDPKFPYVEKRVKGVLQRVILSLEGNNSGVVSRLLKRYERLDKTTKLILQKREELNSQIKTLGDELFDAEDALITRVVETVSYTFSLSAAEKAEQKAPKKRIDFEAAYRELAALAPELQEAAEMILEKYTEITPAVDTPVALRVKSKLSEGLVSNIRASLRALKRIFNWTSFDRRLAAIKAKYPV